MERKVQSRGGPSNAGVIAARTFLFPRLPTNSFIGFHNGNIKGKIEGIQTSQAGLLPDLRAPPSSLVGSLKG